jgi:serine/threonine protein kinase
MDPNANTLGIFTEPVKQIACPHCNAELDVSDFSVFEDIVCPACQKTIKVPGRLGNFILIDELGRGAMGCVYLARDESLGRLVALKVMRREYGDDPKMLETLQKEAKAMATLNHRNVVSVYSFGREQGQPFFVMELLQGERLDAMMANGGIVDEVRLLEIALDVAGGLEAAGSAGLTHGDIKPANILMNEAGVAKVVDFGLARFMDPDAEIEIWGTPYYIAPEKARKKGEDSRSDQYSLGATMFHALAGKPPFNGENPTKVVLAALKEETPLISEYNPDLCPRTVSVIRRMMDKTPNKRYPTYASLRSDLQLALSDARAAQEARRRAELEAQAGKKKKKNTLIPIMASVATAILVLIAASVFMQNRRARAATEVTYPGPARSLHEPLLRNVEDRNLRSAAEALHRNQILSFAESLGHASRNIPEIHAAHAWYNFFLAGMLLYAQHPDAARARLEAVVNQDPILFDGGRVPREDPRILARYALGLIRERDLTRALRNAEPYFVHLAELAMGYRLLLEERPNEAARHFRAYAEYRPAGGISWPYVLQVLAPSMHLPRPQIPIPASVADTASTAAPAPAPAPAAAAAPPAVEPPQTAAAPEPAPRALPQPAPDAVRARDDQNRPVFQVVGQDSRQRRTGNVRTPAWSRTPNGEIYFLGSGEVLVNASGLNIQPGRRFTLGAILRIPETTAGEQPAVLIHAGTPLQTRRDDLLFHGFLVILDGVNLQVRFGNGRQIHLNRSVRPDNLTPGKNQLLTLSWSGWNPEGRADNRLMLGLDDQIIANWEIAQNDMPPPLEEQLTLFGRAARSVDDFDFGQSGINVLRAFILDRPVESRVLFEEYRERIAAWNR